MVMENTFHSHVMQEVEARQMRQSMRELTPDKLKDQVEKSLLKYDLKGSTVNRSTVPKDLYDEDEAQTNTNKDLDLREKLYLSRQDRDDLIKQLEEDTQFLQDHNIMDYSLLLGIQKGVQHHKFRPGEQQAALGKLEAVAAHSAQKYYVGIIDILQQWDFKKQLEPWCKSLLGPMKYNNFHPDELSAVEPGYYRDRFLDRINRHIAAQKPRQSLQSTEALVERIAKNLRLNDDQTGRLDGLLRNAEDLTEALVNEEEALVNEGYLEPEPEPQFLRQRSGGSVQAYARGSTESPRSRASGSGGAPPPHRRHAT